VIPWTLLPLLAATSWLSPLPASTVSADFVPAATYGSGHRGLDLSAQPGVVVRAVTEGTVALAGQVAGKPVVVLLVDDPSLGRLRVTYEPVIPDVEAGDLVLPGQQIGTLADSGGHCGRVPHCLHLGVKQSGHYLNPAGFLPGSRVVLKPVR